MIACQFIFEPGNYDDDFHRLDADIDAYSQTLEGFIGVDRWVSPDGLRRNSIYYFADEHTLRAFSQYSVHLQAKAEYARWYRGYHIIVAEVTARYGDGALPHPTDKHRP